MRVPLGLRLAVVVSIAMTAGVCAQEIRFRHFTPDDVATPLPSAGVQALAQDHFGNIWIGFYATGLARYDGHSFETFDKRDGLADLTVRDLIEDRGGRLWVATESGLVVSDKPLASYAIGERPRFTSHIGAASLVRSRLRRNDLAADAQGQVWVGTAGEGVLRYWFDGETLRGDRIALPRAVTTLKSARDGSVLVALDDNALLFFAGGSTRADVFATRFASPVTFIHESADGAIWAGCANGSIWRAARTGPFALVSSELTERIVGIIDTPDGYVWAASLGSGMLRLRAGDPAQRRVYRRADGLISDELIGLLRDREGNVWIGQYGGLSRFRPNWEAFQFFTATSHAGEEPLLPSAYVSGVIASSPVMWVGTGSGVAGIRDGHRVETINDKQGLLSNQVYSLGMDAAGNLWIGTLGGLSVRRSDGKLTSFPIGAVYACKRWGDTMWFASTSGLHCYVGGRFVDFGTAAGFPPTGVTNLAFDDQGRLWVGTHASGLYRSTAPIAIDSLPGAKFEAVWTTKNGAPSDIVRSLIPIGGELWIGSAGGVSVIATDSLKPIAHFDAANGLGGENVFSMDARGNRVWVSQGHGLAEIDATSKRIVRIVTKEDGLVDDETWSYGCVVAAGDGTVYFATPKGLTLYRPELDVLDAPPPTLRWKDARFTSNRWGANEVRLEYAALTFGDERRVRFRTRVEGYEPNWSAPKSDFTLRYTNLPAYVFPRTYIFEVIASNDGKRWSAQPLRYSQSVAPAWWRTWWAGILYVFVFGTALLVLNRIRTRGLERLVAERTAALMAQTHELETLDAIVEVINREVRLEPLLQTLLDQSLRLFPQAEKAAFIVVDHDNDRTEVVAASGYDREIFREVSFSLEEARHRYTRGAEMLGEGVYLVRDWETLAGREKTRHLPVPKCMLAMSMTLGGKVEGYLVFDNFTDPNGFSRSDVRKLSRLREHAISAIAKARALKEVEQANQAKSAFLASMSHELRTPLNSIIGFAEVLLQKVRGNLEPRQAKFLELILASGNQLLNIINDILDLSKVEAGKMEVFRETFSVRDTVEGVVLIMKGMASKHGIRFEVDVAGMPDVETDQGKLKQILYNLLSNAVKFSNDGSTVRVAVRCLPSSEESASLLVSVADQGVGIAPEDLPKIFEEFRRVGISARKAIGTGLGLSLVKRMTELLGGSVWVESTVGRGSTFSFRLPVRIASAVRSDIGAVG